MNVGLVAAERWATGVNSPRTELSVNEHAAQVRMLTEGMRSGRDALSVRVRQLLEERGIPTAGSFLAVSFPDDVQFEFGVVVTPERRVFRFGYDYLHVSPGEGTFTEWEDLTDRWRTSAWRDEVEAAFGLLGQG